MGTFDRKTTHQSGDVVHREFPSVERRMLGNIARKIAAGVIGNATVAPGKVAKLAFPPAHVGRKFVDEDDWMALTAFLKIEPCSGRFGIRHCVSPHPQFASGKCRNRKTDRFAIARLLASCPCVAWRAMTDAPVVIAAESSQPRGIGDIRLPPESISRKTRQRCTPR